ncbi:ferric-chelate reductase 1 [Biomphalaria glabrata]|nr:ferric-chelate reductase 1 [Biomphalaria glabrata]
MSSMSFISALPFLWAYPQGAPGDTCMNMMPKHRGTQSQLDGSVYRVTSNTTYTPGQAVTVTVDSPSGAVFKGVQVRARMAEGNPEDIIGEFTNLRPVNKLNYINCQGKRHNMVTHNNTDLVSSVTVDWIPPNENVGPIVFDVTVVQSFFKFYFGLHSAVVNPSPTAGSLSPWAKVTNTISPAMTLINWDECGETKGCLLYPRYCSGADNCKAGLTYKMNTNDSTISFEMMAKAEGYVSMGLSHDALMGDDQTISCTTLFDTVNIQNGFNFAVNQAIKYNIREPKNNLTNLEAAKIDGTIMCRFTKPISEQMNVVLEEFGDYPPTPFTFNTREKLFVFIAWGKTYTLTDVIAYHTEMPFVSEDSVDFTENKIHRGSVMPTLIRAHASLMAVAWLGFAGLAIIMARYYKEGFNDKKFCGIKIWFHIHRISAIMTFLLTVAGLVLVLVKLDGKITQDESAYTHMCLGFTVVALVCAQVLSGLLRPGLDSKIRPLFNFFHKLMGTAALIIAAAAIINAYKITDFTYEMRQFGERTVAVWAGTFVFLEIVHVAYNYFASRVLVMRADSDEYNLDKMSNNLEPEESTPPSNILLAIFIFFICCSITAALIMTIFF